MFIFFMIYIPLALMMMIMMMMSTLAILMLFPPKHSQYLAFSFDGGGLGGLGDKGRYPFRSIDFRIYSFTRSMS